MPTEYQQFTKFSQFSKVTEGPDGKHETFSCATSEAVDADGEICDYESQKPLYIEWENHFKSITNAAGIGESRGAVRWQHSMEIAGKVTQLTYDDQAKRIYMRTQPIPDKWPLIKEGFVTGTSQAGTYVRRWCSLCGADIPKGNECDKCGKVLVRYCAKIVENSYVDLSCNPDCAFQYVKNTGEIEMRKFKIGTPASKSAEPQSIQKGDQPNGTITISSHGAVITSVGGIVSGIDPAPEVARSMTPTAAKAVKKTKRKAGEDLTADCFLLVGDREDPSTWALPFKFSTEAKTVSHLRSALSRFNQVEGFSDEQKSAAWKKLLRLCKKYSVEVGSKEQPKASSPVMVKFFAVKGEEGVKAYFADMVDKAASARGMAKGMYEVARLAQVIEDVAYLRFCARYETDCEGDDSSLPEDLQFQLEGLIRVFLDMAQEEASELAAA